MIPRSLLPVLLLLTLPACHRAPDATLRVSLPEAQSPAERLALRDHLLQDNTLVSPEHPLYLDIQPLDAPPGLLIRYNPGMTAPKNIEHQLADLGYTANTLPGNPAARAAFRRRLPTSTP